jgi:NAD-dependent dihydropyrimidine dehydrogenase PreA subunit
MVVEISIVYSKCELCKACVKACSYGVFEWLDDIPVVVNAANCAICLECMKNCPSKAINVEER